MSLVLVRCVVLSALLAFSAVVLPAQQSPALSASFTAAQVASARSCNANDNPSEVADFFISRCRKGSIRREFPSQYLYYALGDIKRNQSTAGKKAWKLLNDSRFAK